MIRDGIATVRAAGKAPGILVTDPALARDYVDAGALFVAIGLDTTLLVRAARELIRSFREGTPPPAAPAFVY